MTCDCMGFERDPDLGGWDDPICYCGHAQDEHDQDGQCLVEDE